MRGAPRTPSRPSMGRCRCHLVRIDEQHDPLERQIQELRLRRRLELRRVARGASPETLDRELEELSHG